MPTAEGNFDVLKVQYENILGRLDEVIELYKSHDSRIIKIEAWMNRRDREIDLSDDRFKMIEQQLDEHEMYINVTKGAKMGVGDLVSRVALLIGMVAALYGIYIKGH